MRTDQMISLENIHINAKRRLRALRADVVDDIANSMKEQGQLQSIIVRSSVENDGRGYDLVAGWHRLEAAKKLGKSSIRCMVLFGDAAAGANLAEIDENLVRAELSPAERAMHIDARKTLYEKKHPETKQGKSPGKAGGGKKASDAKSASFVDDTARKTGKAKRTIALDATRGKKVKVLSDVVGTSLDKGEELDALAKLDEANQRKLADQAKAGENVSARNVSESVKAKADRAEQNSEKKIRDQHLASLAAKALTHQPDKPYLKSNTAVEERALAATRSLILRWLPEIPAGERLDFFRALRGLIDDIGIEAEMPSSPSGEVVH